MQTNTSQLMYKLEQKFQTKFGDDIDEYVLRGIWKRNGFKSLYVCDAFKNFSTVDKARFEGIVDDYFNNNNRNNISIKEESPLIPYNTDQIAEPDPNAFYDIELEVNSDINNNKHNINNNKSNKNNINNPSLNIPVPTSGYPICGNACMDCCEDVCEHAICCNCASVIYDVWDESIAVDNNNTNNVVLNGSDNPNNLGGNDVVNGFFHNACEDCCEDICEHAICCNCTASVVSHWFEAAEVDNGNVTEPVLNGTDTENRMDKLQRKALAHIKRAKKICCTVTCLIAMVLIVTGVLLFYFLYYKPNYQ